MSTCFLLVHSLVKFGAISWIRIMLQGMCLALLRRDLGLVPIWQVSLWCFLCIDYLWLLLCIGFGGRGISGYLRIKGEMLGLINQIEEVVTACMVSWRKIKKSDSNMLLAVKGESLLGFLLTDVFCVIASVLCFASCSALSSQLDRKNKKSTGLIKED